MTMLPTSSGRSPSGPPASPGPSALVVEPAELVVHPGLFGRELRLASGLGGRALVVDPDTGRSAILGDGTARLLGCVAPFDRPAATAELSRRTGRPAEECRQALDRLQLRLADARLLGPVAGGSRRRLTASLRHVPVVRVLRLHPRRLLHPPPRRLGPRAPRRALVALAVVALALLPLLLPRHTSSPGQLPWFAWLVLLGLLSASNAVHEGAHALACRLLGVAVEEVGVGLWWGCLPFCYVEHRRLSRLSRRSEHAFVALAGPAVHLLLAGLAAAVGLLAAGTTVGAVGALAAPLLTSTVLVNLNPVLPTDGYRALEALSGRVGFRSAAVDTIGAVLLRLPRRGRSPSRVEQGLHWLYAVGCLGWLVVSVSLAVHLGHQLFPLLRA